MAYGECIITGCSNQLCAEEPTESDCADLPWYTCLEYTECGNYGPEENCSWLPTDDYLDCLDSFDIVVGCTNTEACNYVPEASLYDGSCWMAGDQGWCDCYGHTADDCGVCDGDNDCYGCTDMDAFNFDPYASLDSGDCEYAEVTLGISQYVESGYCSDDTYTIEADCTENGTCSDGVSANEMDCIASTNNSDSWVANIWMPTSSFTLTIQNETPVAGFVISLGSNFEDFFIISATPVDIPNWMVYNGENIVIGFDLQGETIYPGSYELVNVIVDFTGDDGVFYFTDAVISDPDADAILTDYSGYLTIGAGEIPSGCMDELACNFENGLISDDGTCEFPWDYGSCDCNGNITDCSDVCGGSDEFDECFVCGGDGFAYPFCDCNGALWDQCGICGGTGTTYYYMDADGDGWGFGAPVSFCPDEVPADGWVENNFDVNDALYCESNLIDICNYCVDEGDENPTECSPPDSFNYYQSTLQAFYFINDVTIDGIVIESDDWVGVFNGNVCVGARIWNTDECNSNLCEVPAQGYNNTEWAEGYMLAGEIPTFQIWDASEDIYYAAEPSENYPWENFGLFMIESLVAVVFPGCSDSSACNYDPNVTEDDGSCYYNDGALLHVSIAGDNSSCGSAEYPLGSIQYAIDMTFDGDTVLVSAGTYYENINFNGKNILIKSLDGPFSAELSPLTDNIPVVTFNTNETSNAILSGFTIKDGGNVRGSAINISGTSPTIENCIIKDCNNTQDGSFGAIATFTSSSQIKNCLVYNNYTGIFFDIQNGVSGTKLINCTIVNNQHVGLLSSVYNSIPEIYNSLIYGNEVNIEAQNSVFITYSLVEGGYEGIGNIDLNPQFTDPDNEDFTLQPTSPCIDTGDPDSDPDPDGTRADMGAYPYEQYQNSISMHEGANLISFYVIPADGSVGNVLSPLGDNATGIIGSGSAAIILNGNWVGSLTEISPVSGYWLILQEAAVLNQTGIPIQSDQLYSFESGVNLISYPFETANGITEAIPDLYENYITGIIGEGTAATQLTPGLWVGSLQNLEKNKGYWFATSGDFAFAFETPDGLARSVTLSESPYPYTQSTQQAFYFIESIENIQMGDWVLAYNGDVIIGAREWTGAYTDVPAMGDDGGYYSQGYINTGAIPQFKVSKNGELIDMEGDISQWSNNGIFMVSTLTEAKLLPEEFTLNNAYPNPFNPSTTISFALPINTEVSILIYNLQGREVATLLNGNLDAGYNSVKWNASYYSSGTYLIRMESGSFTQTQKVVLLK